MRRLFTTEEARAKGLTRSALRWGEKKGRWRHVRRDVWVVGPEEPSPLEYEVAEVIGTHSVARGHLAGVLHDLDAVELDGRPTRRSDLAPERVEAVKGIPCADGLQTLIDLAASLDPLRWEQALESGLHKKLLTIPLVETSLPELARSRAPGTAMIRRVLDLRPDGAPPTESLLETIMVQLIREVPGLPDPVRQFAIWRNGRVVVRIDLCWPDLGLFIELDGQQHRGQPIYDASRQTLIVALTGWLCARFSWYEVTRVPRDTVRRLAVLGDQARRRPVSAS